jgi:hypothetical protein
MLNGIDACGGETLDGFDCLDLAAGLICLIKPSPSPSFTKINPEKLGCEVT